MKKRLSFTEPGRAWAPSRSGNYGQDCRTGRLYAGELIHHIQEEGASPLLGHIARAIGEGGIFDGVEVGFFQAIAEAVQFTDAI